jgi:hypothetical protein
MGEQLESSALKPLFKRALNSLEAETLIRDQLESLKRGMQAAAPLLQPRENDNLTRNELDAFLKEMDARHGPCRPDAFLRIVRRFYAS